MEAHSVETTILERGRADPSFRDRLMSDPHAAILEATGIRLPEEVSVMVHENTRNVVHLVLPASPAALLNIDALEEEASRPQWRTTATCSTSGDATCKPAG
jgi:hypothetical protein